MASGTLETGAYYIPNTQAWDRYKNEGGSAELKARTVSSQQDNLAQLTGLPGYWWRVSELVVSIHGVAYEVPASIEVPKPKFAHATPMVIIEVPRSKLSADGVDGDLYVEYEEETDEHCLGEDCGHCGGEGCTIAREPLTAVNLLSHLLDDYDNSATSFAEAYSLDAADVDKMYRDLLVLVRAIRYQT